ncbi:hypothetical protein HDV00_011977 [Rhizophlyctis rosea]|nr:hypothetical protein HDV00_011977 [Rhizophlyctis rosea]
MDEVQNAMREGMGLLDKKEWLTPTLLTKIASSPTLSRAFEDPTFLQFAAALQNPQQAPTLLARAQKERPDLVAALQELAGLLGSEFDRLADRDEGSNSALRKEEEAQVKKLLEDEDVKEALGDVRVQRLLDRLRDGAGGKGVDFHALMKGADEDVRRKIRKLVECGVLAVQR